MKQRKKNKAINRLWRHLFLTERQTPRAHSPTFCVVSSTQVNHVNFIQLESLIVMTTIGRHFFRGKTSQCDFEISKIWADGVNLIGVAIKALKSSFISNKVEKRKNTKVTRRRIDYCDNFCPHRILNISNPRFTLELHRRLPASKRKLHHPAFFLCKFFLAFFSKSY